MKKSDIQFVSNLVWFIIAYKWLMCHAEIKTNLNWENMQGWKTRAKENITKLTYFIL